MLVCLCITHFLPVFFIYIFLLCNNFLYQIVCTTIFHRRSLDSLIYDISYDKIYFEALPGKNAMWQSTHLQPHFLTGIDWNWCMIITSIIVCGMLSHIHVITPMIYASHRLDQWWLLWIKSLVLINLKSTARVEKELKNAIGNMTVTSARTQYKRTDGSLCIS